MCVKPSLFMFATYLSTTHTDIWMGGLRKPHVRRLCAWSQWCQNLGHVMRTRKLPTSDQVSRPTENAVLARRASCLVCPTTLLSCTQYVFFFFLFENPSTNWKPKAKRSSRFHPCLRSYSTLWIVIRGYIDAKLCFVSSVFALLCRFLLILTVTCLLTDATWAKPLSWRPHSLRR